MFRTMATALLDWCEEEHVSVKSASYPIRKHTGNFLKQIPGPSCVILLNWDSLGMEPRKLHFKQASPVIA